MVISFSNVWQSKCAATFYVFQYGMPEGHWAGTEWILGLADRLPLTTSLTRRLPVVSLEQAMKSDACF
jgi:hypothetical protein